MSRLIQGEDILKEISIKKRMLVEVAMEKGLHSTETIRCSQELDEMINSFYRCMQQGYRGERE